ncbi:MAG TPA: MFS transporter [Dermatophilaceae bacterium]|nr:MFS transporter [Dermatophilaceae bacterium]
MVTAAPAPPRARIHRAWYVAAVTLAALVLAAAFRSSTGALIEPLEAEFGWTRATTSGAITVNLVVYGITAPFAAALMERFGPRRVVAYALLVVGVGSGLTLVMRQAWQLWLLWGLLIGVGTGAMALVFGAIVANRWFVRRRGLVTGIFSAANATGQLIFLPVIVRLADGPGWRYAASLVTIVALLLVPLVALLLADSPATAGTTAYGCEPLDHGGVEVAAAVAPRAAGEGAARVAVRTLREAARTRVFWLLFGTFWVCGWSTNGLIQTHLIPAAHDHGMPPTAAAGLLAVIGVFDIVGTVCSGWLTDKYDPRILLFAYYWFRGLSLLVVPWLLGPAIVPPLWAFIVFYGLDWVATVPPTVALCRTHFGLERSGVVFGWVFAAHMVGAGVAASFAGWVRQSTGDYLGAWLTAGGLCLAAALAVLAIAKSTTPRSDLVSRGRGRPRRPAGRTRPRR